MLSVNRSAFEHPENNIRYRFIIFVWLVGLSLLLAACNKETQAKTHTIGIICYDERLEKLLEGFKVGMAELGHVEGKNVTYIYNGVVKPDPRLIDEEIEALLARNIDLFYTVGTLPTLRAKEAVKGTKIAVIFAPVIDPVAEGVVDSLRFPGGNVTGVQSGNTLPKAMEWLVKLVPQATKVYVPYNPKDEVSFTSIVPLRKAAATLRVELLLDELDTSEQVAAAIATLPKNTTVFIIPMPSIILNNDLFRTAAERGIAVGSNMFSQLEAGALVAYAVDYFFMGKQAARLADQTLRGTAPADLPVETAEYFLSINLRTASTMGLDIPDEILEQADTIIR